MISKRTRRSTAPQENIRQFSLSTVKGIDCTKAPTDNSSVVRMTNLVVNPDGSLSPRKFIKQVNKFEDTSYVEYLYDGVSTLRNFIDDDSYHTNYVCIFDAGVRVTFTLIYTDYRGIVHRIPDVVGIPTDCIEGGGLVHRGAPFNIVNHNTSTTVGNMKLRVDAWLETLLGSEYNTDEAFLNQNLYDEITADKASARYLRVYKDAGSWYIEIKSPEMNVLTTADGELSFNPNTTLDNPFALRDVYNSTAPGVKGILSYMNSKKTDTEILPNPVYDGAPEHVTSNVIDSKNSTFRVDTNLNTKNIRVTAEYVGDPGLYGASVTSDFTIKYHGARGVVGTIERTHTFDYIIVSGTVRLDTSVGPHGHVLQFPSTSIVRLSLFSEIDFDDYEIVDIDIGTSKKSSSISCTTAVVAENDFEHSVELSDNTISVNCTFKASTLHPFRLGAMYIDPEDGLGSIISNNFVKLTYFCRVRSTILHIALPETVAELTESTKQTSYRIATTYTPEHVPTVLKAFCNFPTSPSTVLYASWLKSADGINWLDATELYSDTVYVRDVENGKLIENASSDETYAYTTRLFAKVNAQSERDSVLLDEYVPGSQMYAIARPDILKITSLDEAPYTYMFRLCALQAIGEDDPEHDASLGTSTQYKVALEYGRALYTPRQASEVEFVDYEYSNSVLGNKLYHKKSIYSYGAEKFYNNIFVSGIDNYETPLYNIIDVDASQANTVTCLFPWRDFLISATENALYLHSKHDEGFTTKTISASVGIPKEYSKCCKPALNGIVFMSGNKIYFAYPNVYAGDDSSINLTDISLPIEEYLENYTIAEGYDRFAFVTSSDYVLMLPSEDADGELYTLCLRYNLSTKTWEVCTYPVVFYDYKLFSFDNICLYAIHNGSVREFRFDCTDSEDGSYGDVVDGNVVPIEFEWDTGQKTDSIGSSKQFVESKLVFATGDSLEAFPMNLVVSVDGDPHVTRRDVSTDSPFWNTDPLDKGTAGTSFRLSSDGVGYSDKGIIRQLIVRYSGRGRSVRHILSGKTQSKFRFYEAYVRYKTLNVKK